MVLIPVTYIDGDMSCVCHLKVLGSMFSNGTAPVSFVFYARPKTGANSNLQCHARDMER